MEVSSEPEETMGKDLWRAWQVGKLDVEQEALRREVMHESTVKIDWAKRKPKARRWERKELEAD